MKRYTAQEIALHTGGRVISGDPQKTASRVSIDSREVTEGDLFCAIKGERNDGHDFVGDAVLRGANIALVERIVSLPEAALQKAAATGFALVLVDSTVKSLGLLARHYRSELTLTTTVGITGSVGKTSTKDLVHSILSRKFRTYKNPGNLNSHIGLPLALLNMSDDYEYAVLEMAMRKRGEIRELCEIARPAYGVLTDISASHIGLLGSIEEIAMAKAELLESLPPWGLALLAGDNPWVRKVGELCKSPKIYYGFKDDSDLRAWDVTFSEDGSTAFKVSYRGNSYEFRLPIPGAHQVENALAGIGLGLYMGISPEEIQEGLSHVSLSPMRQEVIKSNGLLIINDAYNASEKSMKAALDLLNMLGKGRKIAILGDMLEMGTYGPEAHLRVGAYAREKADVLIAIGELGAFIKKGWDEGTGGTGYSSWFSDKMKALDYVKSVVEPGDTILVKASRGMGFETIVATLKQCNEEGVGK